MSALQLLEATYADISTITKYVNNLISPRCVAMKNFDRQHSNNAKMFPTVYIARTPTFSGDVREELSRERSRLRNASLSSSSTQQELVQRAISVLCNRQMKSNSYIKKMRFADQAVVIILKSTKIMHRIYEMSFPLDMVHQLVTTYQIIQTLWILPRLQIFIQTHLLMFYKVSFGRCS